MLGNPEVNAKYILALCDKMVKLGHPGDVITINREQAMNRLMLTVLSEKVRCISHAILIVENAKSITN